MMSMVYTILTLAVIASVVDARSSMAFEPAIQPANFVFNVPVMKSKRENANTPDQVALQFVQEKLGLAATDVVIKNIVPTIATGITSVYLRQKVNGIEVTNADININVDKYVLFSSTKSDYFDVI